MHSSTASENLTTCNTKENSLFQFPSIFQNRLQLCHLEASPCQATEERDRWREMVVLTDPWSETADLERGGGAVRGRGSGTGFAPWAHRSPSQASHRCLGSWARGVLQKSWWWGVRTIQRNRRPMVEKCLHSDGHSELSSTFSLGIFLFLFHVIGYWNPFVMISWWGLENLGSHYVAETYRSFHLCEPQSFDHPYFPQAVN